MYIVYNLNMEREREREREIIKRDREFQLIAV